MSQGKTVFVGMSGGVDSSVSAALLLQQGYRVVGVFIKVWQADFLPCNWREERREAMRVSAHLGIPFLTLDLEKEYKQEVVDYMIREYGSGRVPNPDVMCNKHVKFGAFLSFARKHNADFVATGHYARVEHNNEDGYQLLTGVDKEKDQSYFLWTLEKELLSQILFPVGHLKKSEVRAIAKELDLPNAEKKDSQGLCFMGPVDMQDFLKHFLKTEAGYVLSEDGEQIGTHEGAILYTIGQRHGFSTMKSSALDKPFYVVSKDVHANTITVAHNDPTKAGRTRTVHLSELYLRSAPKEYTEMRIRYRGELHRMQLDVRDHSRIITLEDPIDGVSAGQSVVFYNNEICIGGGVVTNEE